MRQAKQPADRNFRQRPQGPAEPHRVEQQRPGFERHDHEGRERNGDDVRAYAVEAGAVEMEQGERDQGELDRKPGQDQPHGSAPDAHEYALVAALEQAARPGGRVQGDDCGDRSEAHLEARAGQRLGPEQEHDQRADRDQPDAERVAAERDPGEDQQRRDAASHRRHLGAGEQGVADASGRGDGGGHQHEVEAQRQPLAQRQKLEAQEHREGDHGGDVQPADREQMRQAAASHRHGVVLADRILVAGDESDGDSRLRALQPAMDVPREPLPDRVEPAARARA